MKLNTILINKGGNKMIFEVGTKVMSYTDNEMFGFTRGEKGVITQIEYDKYIYVKLESGVVRWIQKEYFKNLFITVNE